MSEPTRHARLADRLKSAVYLRIHRMTSPTERDEGLEALEKMIIGAVVLAAAVGFGVVFGGINTDLVAKFKSAVGK